MNQEEAATVHELGKALGWPCTYDGSFSPSARFIVRVFSDGPEFEHYDAAMAYLQALGVRDET